jgi:hypothetical protein
MKEKKRKKETIEKRFAATLQNPTGLRKSMAIIETGAKRVSAVWGIEQL